MGKKNNGLITISFFFNFSALNGFIKGVKRRKFKNNFTESVVVEVPSNCVHTDINSIHFFSYLLYEKWCLNVI